MASGGEGSGGESTSSPITGGVSVFGIGGKPADGGGAGAGASSGAREDVDSLAAATAHLHLGNGDDEIGGEGGNVGVDDGGEHSEGRGHHKSRVGLDVQQRQKVCMSVCVFACVFVFVFVGPDLC